MSFCLCSCICADYFPLCFSQLLTVSLFYLFNVFLSLLDSVIVIHKQSLSSPPLTLCLAHFPSLLMSALQRCALGEHLLFSFVFLPLFPLLPLLSVTVFSSYVMLERLCPCSFALCSQKAIFLPIPPHLLLLLETIVTRDQNLFLNTNNPTV